jgi:hypothetical protein
MASREHRLRAQIATEYSRPSPDPDRIAELQRQRAVVRIEDHARKVLADAPPLTAEQHLRLARVMLGGDDAAA